MKTKGQKGKGKDYIETLKYLKKLCIKYYGIGFLFCNPKIRAALLESMNEFINELIGLHNDENN